MVMIQVADWSEAKPCKIAFSGNLSSISDKPSPKALVGGVVTQKDLAGKARHVLFLLAR